MHYGIKKVNRFLSLIVMVFVFACFFACGSGNHVQDEDSYQYSPQGETTQTVTENKDSGSNEENKSDDNPYSGGLENGGNFVPKT